MPIQEIVEPLPTPPPSSRSTSKTPRPTPKRTPELVRPPKPGSVADWALRSHCVECDAEPGEWCRGYDISEASARLRERQAELAKAHSSRRAMLAHAASLLHNGRQDAGRKARLREYHRLLDSGAVSRVAGYRPTWQPRETTKSFRRAQRRNAQLAAVLTPAKRARIERMTEDVEGMIEKTL